MLQFTLIINMPSYKLLPLVSLCFARKHFVFGTCEVVLEGWVVFAHANHEWHVGGGGGFNEVEVQLLLCEPESKKEMSYHAQP